MIACYRYSVQTKKNKAKQANQLHYKTDDDKQNHIYSGKMKNVSLYYS